MYNGLIGIPDQRVDLMKKGEYLLALDRALTRSYTLENPEAYNRSAISFFLKEITRNADYYEEVVKIIEKIYGFQLETILNLCLINGSVYDTISYDYIGARGNEPVIGSTIQARFFSKLPIGEEEEIPGFLFYENGKIFAFSYSREGIWMYILDVTRTFERKTLFSFENFAEEIDIASRTTFFNCNSDTCFLRLRKAFEKAKCEYSALLGTKKPSMIKVLTAEDATKYKKYYTWNLPYELCYIS